jgi:hypothetical protein
MVTSVWENSLPPHLDEFPDLRSPTSRSHEWSDCLAHWNQTVTPLFEVETRSVDLRRPVRCWRLPAPERFGEGAATFDVTQKCCHARIAKQHLFP